MKGAPGHTKARPGVLRTEGRCTDHSLSERLPSLPKKLKSPRPQPLDTLQLPSWQELASPTWPEGSQLLRAHPSSVLAPQLA